MDLWGGSAAVDEVKGKTGWSLAVHWEYLHDAIPVVTSGNLEECEESHPKVLKGGVAAHSLTGVVSVTHWKRTGEVQRVRLQSQPVGGGSNTPKMIDWCCWRPTVFQGSREEFLEAEVKGSWTSFRFWPVKNLRVAHIDLKHFRPPAQKTELTCAPLVASERTDPSIVGQVSTQRDVEMEWDGFGFDLKPFTVSIHHDS